MSDEEWFDFLEGEQAKINAASTYNFESVNWAMVWSIGDRAGSFEIKEFYSFLVGIVGDEKRRAFIRTIVAQGIVRGGEYCEAHLLSIKSVATAMGIYAAPQQEKDGAMCIPPVLQTPKAEALFKKLEKTTARYRGKDLPILDRSVWPWKPITMNSWIHIASFVRGVDKIGGTWSDWEAVVGGSNFRQRLANIGTPTGLEEIAECIKEYY